MLARQAIGGEPCAHSTGTWIPYDVARCLAARGGDLDSPETFAASTLMTKRIRPFSR